MRFSEEQFVLYDTHEEREIEDMKENYEVKIRERRNFRDIIYDVAKV